MDKNAIEAIKKYVRAANYLTVTQIYLQDNFLLQKKLESKDIKPRLFGHWGTCPGINFVYGNINYFAKKHNQSTIFVLGPGHGFPALQANLFLEKTLSKYYDKAVHSLDGISYISKMFSWPYGFSSHSSPETPGLILEGGELGYSLSTAYGAVLDNPDLLAVCLIGDGEAETGPMATAWHLNKLVDPVKNGIVLPILHLNGFKISGPTIFGRMSDEELKALFTGYGYEPFFVRGENIYEDMVDTLEVCHKRIEAIKKSKSSTPRLPMIILQTPKGWTTVKELRGQKIEGTILSHQVVMPNVKGDEQELEALETWLSSYNFAELFDLKKGFTEDLLSIIPPEDLLIGNNSKLFGKDFKKLLLPKAEALAKEVKQIGEIQSNSMRMAGVYLREVFSLNKEAKNFRLMSPDETYSNRLDDVFAVTKRAFVWPLEANDKDIDRNGRVMEMLSEHNMHGLAQGYILTGRHAAFTTYEAFAQIFSSMSHMYMKFLKYVRENSWHGDVSSMNYLLTSTAWRQEHNGYSHQNPSFLSGMLDKHNCFTKVYFPADDNSMLAVLNETFSAKGQINTIIAGKTPEPRWLTFDQAKKALVDGLMVWDFASDKDPQIVLVGIGDYVTKEVLAAIDMLKKDFPEIAIRFVNVLRLTGACSCKDDYHPQIPNAESYFTSDKPVIVNFHGYSEVMKSILFDVKNPQRFSIHGYKEEGGTTTPFDMQVRNETSRYHLAIEVLQTLVKQKNLEKGKADKFIDMYKKILAGHKVYVKTYGKDPDGIEQWQWKANPHAIIDVDSIMNTDILNSAKTIAFIGLSDNPERHSNRVATYFKSKGFKIIPVNPNVTEVLGEKAYPDLLSIPKDIKIDIVDVFRRPEEVIPHLKEVLERGGISTVWLQEGVGSIEAEDFAKDYGIAIVTNFCIMEAYKNLPKQK
jgi:xylulose-5-phosphate/fructose-6-phosphate phosphoketolase